MALLHRSVANRHFPLAGCGGAEHDVDRTLYTKPEVVDHRGLRFGLSVAVGVPSISGLFETHRKYDVIKKNSMLTRPAATMNDDDITGSETARTCVIITLESRMRGMPCILPNGTSRPESTPCRKTLWCRVSMDFLCTMSQYPVNWDL